MDNIMEKLHKAGIDARLVSKIQDEITIDLESCPVGMQEALSKGCKLLPAPEEFKGFEAGVITEISQLRQLLPRVPKTMPVFIDDRPALIRGSEVSDEELKNFVEEIRELYLKNSYHRTILGDTFDARRYISGKSPLDSND